MYADAETGLYYWNARYYDPKIGRGISSDPIGLAGGLNTYTYALNNPLRYIDPSGLANPSATDVYGSPPYEGLGPQVYSYDPVADYVNRVVTGQIAKEGLQRIATTVEAACKGNTDAGVELAMMFSPAGITSKELTYLYQKVGASGEHLKFGITNNPATRYTAEELNGGRLKIIAQGERSEMLQLERTLHETLPLGPEERQLFYIQKQVGNGLIAPPYR